MKAVTKSIHAFIILTCFTALYTGLGTAQHSVSGRLENIPSKSAVTGQVILSDNYDPANIDSVFTDSQGNFSFSNKPSSEYTIKFKSDNR